MPTWDQMQRVSQNPTMASITIGRRAMPLHYGDPGSEYRAVESGGGICYRADRATLRVTGRDRAGWLHNLTTNQVKSLTAGEWRYAFVLNVKGRILFDLALLVDEDAIWLDVDERLVVAALAHFSRYTIVEDVQVVDVSDRFARFTVLGTDGLASFGKSIGDSNSQIRLGGSGAEDSWTWSKLPFENQSILAWQPPGFRIQVADLIVPIDIVGQLWSSFTQTGHQGEQAPHPSPAPIGWQALEAVRIESGLPGSVSELNEGALPAETGQLERAVSFNKGCYLGQEVVERMRAHKSVARKLMGLVFRELDAQNSKLATPLPILAGGKSIGTLTSACDSPQLDRTIGLGYVRVASALPGATVQVGGSEAQLCELPFRA